MTTPTDPERPKPTADRTRPAGGFVRPVDDPTDDPTGGFVRPVEADDS